MTEHVPSFSSAATEVFDGSEGQPLNVALDTSEVVTTAPQVEVILSTASTWQAELDAYQLERFGS